MSSYGLYNVVTNHEAQYSIWPKDLELPAGWSIVGEFGSKKKCLDYIDEIWTDMRPLSERKVIQGVEERCSGIIPLEDRWFSFPHIIDRLKERQRVIICLYPNKTVDAFKKRLEMGIVHCSFVETQGRTEVGVRIDADASNWYNCDLSSGIGIVHIEGALTLDFVDVRCVADIDLNTLEGQGYMVKI